MLRIFIDFSQFSQCEYLSLEIVKLSYEIVREEINNHKVKDIESFPILNFLLKSFLIDVQCSHLECDILLGAFVFCWILIVKMWHV